MDFYTRHALNVDVGQENQWLPLFVNPADEVMVGLTLLVCNHSGQDSKIKVAHVDSNLITNFSIEDVLIHDYVVKNNDTFEFSPSRWAVPQNHMIMVMSEKSGVNFMCAGLRIK